MTNFTPPHPLPRRLSPKNLYLPIVSTTKGVLPPRLTTARQTTLAGTLTGGEKGMLITDGLNFMTVQTVKAVDSPTTYHLTIAQPTQQAFYRLRLADLDGTGVYSNIDGLTPGSLPATDHHSVVVIGDGWKSEVVLFSR